VLVTRALHWFRNDLRLRDNRALAQAAREADALLPVFVLDERILRSPRTGAPRVRFLLDCLARLARELAARGLPLLLRRGDPAVVIPQLLREARADLLSFNRDTTPYATRRDGAVAREVARLGVRVLAPKDRVIFESREVLTQAGEPFSVFTPFRRAWQRRLLEHPEAPGPPPRLPAAIPGLRGERLPPARALGFGEDGADLPTGGEAAARRRLERFLEAAVADYERDRDRPALDGTSRLSPYLRFGAISARECFHAAAEASAADARLARGAARWQEELIWREFYAAILEAHPRVAGKSYRRAYDCIRWSRDEARFAAWCEGRTGYPIVDAGMRQLAQTGWMHNRVRMLAASFLVKDLWIDWRRGERFFFQRLVDGDPASNNGGWQWSASTGTDAAPWFRIFNPVVQGRRFDPDGVYLRRFLPELRAVPDEWVHEPWRAPAPRAGYPPPIVRHEQQRRLALSRYRAARSTGAPP
jgi:deoxyribodipyrimidine photo-lyase